MKKLLLSLALTFTALPALAVAPTAPITVLKVFENLYKDDVVYVKKFSELKLDAKTISFINKTQYELNKDNKSPEYHYELTHIRIAEETVESIMFGSKIGNVALFRTDGSNKCHIYFAGNGGMGGCDSAF